MNLTADNENYFFQDITEESDLTFGPVNTLIEDNDGFIWFGCNNGLYFGNTVTIKKIDLFKSDTQNSQSVQINKIYKDGDSEIWVCTHEGLFKHNQITNTFDHIKLYSPNRRIIEKTPLLDILQVEKGKYIITTNSKAYLYTVGESILQAFVIKKNDIDAKISYMHCEEDGKIFLGTNNGHIYTTKNINTDPELLYHSRDLKVRAICKDGNKYLIGYGGAGIEVITLDGVHLYDINKSESGYNHIINDDIRQIIRTDNGEIWIATHFGLVIRSEGKQTTSSYDLQNGLPHRSIFSLTKGLDGGMWMGTWAGGVAYYKACNYNFKKIKIHYNKPSKNVVSGFTEDSKGNIWIGSDEEGGLCFYNPKSDAFVNLPVNKSLLDIKVIKSIAFAGDIIAIGTFKHGLYLYDTKKNIYITPNDSPISGKTDIVSIAGQEKEIWLAERRKVYIFNSETKTIESAFVYNGDGRIWHLFIDSSKNLWVCTDNGLYLKPKGTNIVRQCLTETDSYGLSGSTIYSICEDKDGAMWIGTKGKGVFVYTLHNKSLQKAPDYKKVENSDIYSIISDKDKNIWYYTNSGLYCYNKTNNITNKFDEIDGLPSEHICPNSVYLSKDGELYLGGINGFNVIDPNIVKKNQTEPEVYVSDIIINNKPLSKENTIWSNSLNVKEINNITLSHLQNTLQFKFVTNNFIKSSKNRFKYRLVNYYDEWIELGNNNQISFTKLPSGTYTLEILGSNNDDVWCTEPYALNIQVLAPYWRRWYSLLTYLVIISIVSLLVTKELRTKYKLKREVLSERDKLHTNQLIHDEHVKFFTNISHELRTPLSLIVSPINNLKTQLSGDEKAQNLLNILDRNTQRLLRLTNQTLDFRLLELGKLEPKVEKVDIVQLATEVYRCFEQQILDKEINFKFTTNFRLLEILIDGDMIEKVIFNLLSNSLKYTNNKGHLFLTVDKKRLTETNYDNYICSGERFYGEAIELKIRDDGQGIKADLLPHIFERFSKGTEGHKNSSGIGLHLCKEYTALNNGNILLTSNEGIGSTFILNLPIQDPEIIEKHKTIARQRITQTITKDTDTVYEKIDTLNNDKHKTLLLAEDNNELRSYLKDFLSTFFRVVTAKDGQQAVEILKDLKPDLIITDISMPRMSGLELLTILKKEETTKGIPVIVLTAFTEKKYQMESILKGADSFLTKPIDDSILLAQINNIFQRVGSYKKEQTPNVENNKQSTFVDSIEKIIERNLQNDKFTLNDILSELNISKSTLDRKLKQQANVNPSGLIRDIRLKNAVKLMKTNSFNIDEIATYVGFNSSSYFIRSFKVKYGQTPREYREQHKE